MASRTSTPEITPAFHCGRCNISFTSRKSLIRHRRENQNHTTTFDMPGLILASTYRCEYCEKSCKGLHDLRRHVEEIHHAKRRRLSPRVNESRGMEQVERFVEFAEEEMHPDLQYREDQYCDNGISWFDPRDDAVASFSAIPEPQGMPQIPGPFPTSDPSTTDDSLSVLLPRRYGPPVPTQVPISMPTNNQQASYLPLVPDPWDSTLGVPTVQDFTQMSTTMPSPYSQLHGNDWAFLFSSNTTSHGGTSLMTDLGGTSDDKMSLWPGGVQGLPDLVIETMNNHHHITPAQQGERTLGQGMSVTSSDSWLSEGADWEQKLKTREEKSVDQHRDYLT